MFHRRTFVAAAFGGLAVAAAAGTAQAAPATATAPVTAANPTEMQYYIVRRRRVWYRPRRVFIVRRRPRRVFIVRRRFVRRRYYW